MGQGDPGCQHQAGIITGPTFHNVPFGEWRQWPLLARTRPPGRSALTSAFQGKSGPIILTLSSSLNDPLLT